MSKDKSGYITVTYKVRLYDRHHNWMRNTRKLYNQVVQHYYKILLQDTQLLEQGSYFILRTLEELTIGTKDMRARGEEPRWKLSDVVKIPLYFRRAAISTAIGLARSMLSSGNIRQDEKEISLAALQAEKMDCSPVFYKGMYREWKENSIQLKLFNGQKWVWGEYPFTGRKLPKEGKILSPTLKIGKKVTYLHIPVKIEVRDMRPVQERMEAEESICAVSFPDSDTLAVCVIIKQDGRVEESLFIHGGKAREAKRRKILNRLKKSKQSRQEKAEEKKKRNREDFILDEQKKGRENAAIYHKLEQVNCYYSHKVSREILNYCIKKQIKVIVVPNYTNTIPFAERGFLSTDSFRWQGRSIIRNLKEKAFREGILVSTIQPYHISDCCSECGRKIQRYNEGHKASRNYYGGKLFLCPNGHRGNAAWNTAKNIGRYFLRHYQEEPKKIKKEEPEAIPINLEDNSERDTYGSEVKEVIILVNSESG